MTKKVHDWWNDPLQNNDPDWQRKKLRVVTCEEILKLEPQSSIPLLEQFKKIQEEE